MEQELQERSRYEIVKVLETGVPAVETLAAKSVWILFPVLITY